MRTFYFGCEPARGGHYLWSSEWRKTYVAEARRFLPESLAGHNGYGEPLDYADFYGVGAPTRHAIAFLPRDSEAEGRAALTHIDGWTVLAFWDRSVDRRFKSHSTFVLEGTLDGVSAITAARHAWPSVFARLTFDVVPA